MLPASTIQPPGCFEKRDRLFLGILAAGVLIVGLRGIYNYGYIGQDFRIWIGLILAFPFTPWSFSYVQTNPPGFYWFGSLIHTRVSSGHYLEIMALAFLMFNVCGLWVIYGFLWKGIANWQLRYSAAAFISFVPFRVIHSIVISSDAFTLPIFALAALFTLRLFGNPRRLQSWVGLSLCLSVGMVCKYTFSGLLPAVAVLLAFAVATRLPKGGRLRWGVIGALALALPSEVFLLEMKESAKVKGTVTDLVWLSGGEPSVMRWRDILMPKEADLNLLSAPEYFRDKIYEVRKYSYPGLLHVASVTDVMSLFQPPPGDVSTDWNRRMQKPFFRDRTAFSQKLQALSARWCLVYSGLAFAGTLFCCFQSGKSLLLRRPSLPDAAVVMTALAVGYYSPIFFSLTRLNDPYAAAFWAPRLVLPALVVFFSLGFVMLDSLLGRLGSMQSTLRPFLSGFMGYTLITCLIFVGFLF